MKTLKKNSIKILALQKKQNSKIRWSDRHVCFSHVTSGSSFTFPVMESINGFQTRECTMWFTLGKWMSVCRNAATVRYYPWSGWKGRLNSDKCIQASSSFRISYFFPYFFLLIYTLSLFINGFSSSENNTNLQWIIFKWNIRFMMNTFLFFLLDRV